MIKRVNIRWVDSWGVNPVWESVEEALEHKCCVIETMGFLLKQEEGKVWISMSYDSTTKMVCGVKVIPDKCVVNIIELDHAVD